MSAKLQIRETGYSVVPKLPGEQGIHKGSDMGQGFQGFGF